MATKQQVKANRENSRKSTGPRTPAGKARSSMNALKLGLFAQEALLPGEDPKALAEFHRDLVAQHQPKSVGEEQVIDEIAAVKWRLLRCTKVESGLYHMYRFHDEKPGNEAQAFANDQKNLSTLPKLTTFEAALDRKLERLLKQLSTLQSSRG